MQNSDMQWYLSETTQFSGCLPYKKHRWNHFSHYIWISPAQEKRPHFILTLLLRAQNQRDYHQIITRFTFDTKPTPTNDRQPSLTIMKYLACKKTFVMEMDVWPKKKKSFWTCPKTWLVTNIEHFTWTSHRWPMEVCCLDCRLINVHYRQ